MKINQWQKVREEYPVFKERVYLRTNGGGPLSKKYLSAQCAVLSEASSIGRIWEKYTPYLGEARELVGELFNCNSEEVGFTHNVSLAINHIAAMLPSHYKVLTFSDEYPSNTIPWIERGFEINCIDSSNSGVISVDEVKKAVKDNVKVLVISHVEYSTGFMNDLKEIGEICTENNIVFIVDATQSAGVAMIDFKAINASALVFGTHKWLNAGYSMACMIVSVNFMQQYRSNIVGWHSVVLKSGYTTQQYQLKQNASVFELGHPDFISVFALVAQLKFIQSIGLIYIAERISELRAYLTKKCDQSGVLVISAFKTQNESGLVVLSSPNDVYEKLKEFNIDVTYRNNEILVALSYYNNKSDIDTLLEAIVS
jgi:cysteine desulfurase/selenocysteine lyase